MDFLKNIFKKKENPPKKEYIETFLGVDIFKEGIDYTFEMEGWKETNNSDSTTSKQTILRRSLNIGMYENFFGEEKVFGCYEIKNEKTWYGEDETRIYFQDLVIANIRSGGVYFFSYVEEDVKTKVLLDIFKHVSEKRSVEEIEQKRKKEKAREILNCK